MNTKEFKLVVYGISTELGSSPGQVIEPNVTPNFWACKLEHQLFNVFIICSENNEWALLDSYDPTKCELNFIDNEMISKALSSRFGIVLNLKKKLESDFIALPSMSENDIKYWRPKNLGEGIFNWWD
ncbi:hypothetical protein FLL45_13630 [Aliikangiella marina]|uniref:Uncharacterized protein n=1 Tax=Aliikangiella marina TaxID=1712262 RepID=A0A545T9K5_9GAMM|nr:hypothetical protein [Aliikangiella marina]TQV73900.1 hypothetical protein FLL45_13630 [Aliikangiella marina]